MRGKERDMAKEPTREEINKALFMNLVMMLSTSAIQQMGKIENPLTNKREVDLEGAQASIDMIEMLQTRTKGNLDKDEETLVRQTLSALQMHFVEAVREGGGEPAAGDAEEPKAPSEPAAGPASGSGGEQAGKPKPEPKFHKSYE